MSNFTLVLRPQRIENLSGNFIVAASGAMAFEVPAPLPVDIARDLTFVPFGPENPSVYELQGADVPEKRDDRRPFYIALLAATQAQGAHTLILTLPPCQIDHLRNDGLPFEKMGTTPGSNLEANLLERSIRLKTEDLRQRVLTGLEGAQADKLTFDLARARARAAHIPADFHNTGPGTN